jgi:MFS transporter, DHA2 family, methylenomycin A resistance protein
MRGIDATTARAGMPDAIGRTRRAVLFVMCTGMFLVLLDVTAVNVTLPSIRHDFGAAVPELQWVVDGYAVTIASLLLAGGTVGDRIGHKRVVLAGLVLFGVASAVIGLAPTIGVLIGGRVAQGAGAALLLPGTLAVISRTYTERAEQARAIGTWAAISSLALPIGPLLGGALATASWRAIFLINVPVVLTAAVGVLRRVPDDPPGLHRFDPAGLAGVTVTLASTVFAVIEIGRDGVGPVAVAALGVAVIAMLATVAVEHRVAEPMLPPNLVGRASLLGPNLVALTMNLVFNGTLFITTLYLQVIRGHGPFASGAFVLPLAVPLVVLAPVTSRLVGRIGPRTPVTAGCLLALAGAGVLTLVRRDGSLLPVEGGLLLMGCGAGLVTAAVVAAAVRAIPPERSGFASGVNNASRQTGTALGVAIYGAIAGSPSQAAAFTASYEHLAVASCALWLVAAATAATTIGSVRRAERSGSDSAQRRSTSISVRE